MAEDTESSSTKKRRVIHWNPEAGRAPSRRRWTWPRILLFTGVAIVGLLVVAGAVIRGLKATFGPAVFDSKAAVAVAPRQTVEAANSAFVSVSKAEQAHELAAKAIRELRRLPTDHPVQLEQMIMMEKKFQEAETQLKKHEYSGAFVLFEGLNQDIDAFTKNVKAKGEARQSYDAILLRIKDLELARTLSPGSLEAAFEAAGQGRQLLTDGNFTGAKKVFDGGFAQLKKAEQVLADHVKANLVLGQRALANGEKTAARKAFQAALEKSPGNDLAAQGLKRAENIDRVFALLKQGELLEKETRYADAAESYKKAFALDAVSAAAQEGQSRAARLEKETRFAAATTAAEAAVSIKDWAKAIAEFQNALKVYPQKTEVQTRLKSARENAHKEAVQKALAKGLEYEKAFQWREARDAFNETLQIEPDQADAKEGYTRAGTVIRALLQYEKFIEAAEQLANKAEFQAALRRFNEAMAVKPVYLESSDRVLQLRALLQQQSTPVDVTFNSDGNTWVSITNFRTPSKLESTVIKVLPGDYEVIGRRKGYRDINMLLQIRYGTPPPTVTVTCNVAADRIK